MSREIDMSDLSKLSKEDLGYLRDRGMLSVDQENELLGANAVTSMNDDPTANPPTAPGQGADGSQDLESMSKSELQDMLGEGNYPSSATKADLIDLIREGNG